MCANFFARGLSPNGEDFFSCDIAAISTHIVQSFAFVAAVAAKRAS